jgi:Rrf2 family protein
MLLSTYPIGNMINNHDNACYNANYVNRNSWYNLMLTSKARYGLKAMAILAKRFGQMELVSVEEIAELEGIPIKFLETTLTQLRKRGLLISRRGPSGGFMLARAPEKITVAEVIRTLDGPFAPTTCSRTRNPVKCEGCDDMELCKIRPIMREVRDAMAAVLEERTIRDLTERSRGTRKE